MTGVIAVHCGAGTHSTKYHKNYNKLSRLACQKGNEVLSYGGTAMEAVKAAIVENHPLTNAGYGSNLTLEGRVENDACIMDGRTLLYGGCGAIKNVKNPIELAYDICMKQSESLPFGLIPPSLLVGRGGLTHAKTIGLEIVKNKSLVSNKAFKQYSKYKRLLEVQNHHRPQHEILDTVGAVCIDQNGVIAAASSSGGLLLKRPGRVGQAALYASGVWADSYSPNSEPSVGVCTTGCGEYLVRTQLAKEIASDLQKLEDCPATGLHNSMTEKFLNSRYLCNIKQKLAGALVLYVNNRSGETELLWGHSTESMSIGYMRSSDDKPKALISQLPKDIKVGTKINVSGVHFSGLSDDSKRYLVSS